MFPILLDYQPLFTEFELFVEAIDNKHELALSGHQQFPVIFYCLPCHVFLPVDPLFYIFFTQRTLYLPGSVCVIFLQEKRSFCWIPPSRINGKNKVLIVG